VIKMTVDAGGVDKVTPCGIIIKEKIHDEN
jgi:hypothetical protein